MPPQSGPALRRVRAGDPAARRRQALGAQGEAEAARWYQDHGYEVVARNWRCPSGELDLVARRGPVLVFCEVKTRTSDAFGTPAEAVGRPKQMRIRRLAARWMADNPSGAGRQVRFDVASILANRLEIIEEAF